MFESIKSWLKNNDAHIVFCDASAKIPIHATLGAVGADVSAAECCIIPKGGDRRKVRLGIKAVPPKGYYFQIMGRSGGFLRGLEVMNGAIDIDYRGELCALVKNSTSEDICIEKGERVAQLVCLKYRRPCFKVVAKLPASKRGAGGFGSTGRSDLELGSARH